MAFGHPPWLRSLVNGLRPFTPTWLWPSAIAARLRAFPGRRVFFWNPNMGGRHVPPMSRVQKNTRRPRNARKRAVSSEAANSVGVNGRRPLTKLRDAAR